jgi:transposase-like protein
VYAAVDSGRNRLLYIGLYPTINAEIFSMFFDEFREKEKIDDALFLIDGALWLQAVCNEPGSDSNTKYTGIGIASNLPFAR